MNINPIFMNTIKLLFLVFISAITFGQNESLLNKSFVIGKFDYKNHEWFTEVSHFHSSKTIYLNKEVYQAFKKMYDQAEAEGISLKIISGTRNFDEQKAIWERKWVKYKNLEPCDRAKKILEYSSMPSTSRHHWGTDIDLNSFTNYYFENGKGKKEYDWLTKNANTFGFYQVYTDEERTGYNLERWHWSYLPLAHKYLNFYNKHITYSDIEGFSGSELAESLKTIPDFVNGISFKSKYILKRRTCK